MNTSNAIRTDNFDQSDATKRLDLTRSWDDLVSKSPDWAGMNLGCGGRKLGGFINVDSDQNELADYCADLSQGLSFAADKSIDLIYSENFWADLPFEAGKQLTAECYRVLKSNGRLRIATTDLDHIVYRYTADWQSQSWLEQDPWVRTIHSRGAMLNAAIRDRSRGFLYNEEDLKGLLQNAGFEDIRRFQFGASPERRFWNLETRHDSILILEGVK